MQFQVKTVEAKSVQTQCVVVGIYEGKSLASAAAAIDKAGKGALTKLLEAEGFTGECGKTLTLHHSVGQSTARLVLLGLGKRAALTEQNFARVVAGITQVARNFPGKELLIDLNGIDVSGHNTAWQAERLALTLATELWRFDQLKSKKAPPLALKKVSINVARAEASASKTAIKRAAAVSEGVNYARELGNLPGNICTPRYLAGEAKGLGRNQSKLSVSVLNEKQMKALGMGSLLSVSAGSDEPAQLIVMEYKGAAKSRAPIALVGKGITFDTGGISLKPGAGMDEMKFDMCGAASVFGTMKTLLQLQPAINVVAIVAASENMPSGRATKPGDIVTSMSGQTIEVLNTDAEGRLVLCDALTYSRRYKPKAVVDIATLTGACVIALGNHAHGLYSNDETLAQQLLDAGTQTGDRAWQMPLWDEYQKQLDSNFADMANIGGREGGSITAACFLSRFTQGLKWAHLDIAGTAWKSGGAKGATGRPVPLLVNYLLHNA